MAIIQDFRVRKGLLVTENATVSGNVAVSQQLSVTNAVAFSNTLSVTGAATLSNTISVTGNATFSNVATFGSGNVTFDTSTVVIDAVNNRLSVNAASSTVAMYVNGDANVSGTFTTTTITATTINAGTIAANVFSVTGTTNTNIDTSTIFVDAVNNRVGINTTTPDASLTVTGTANVSSNFRVGGVLTVDGTSGHTGAATFSNTANVVGAAAFSNTMSVAGAVTLSSTLGVTGVITATGGVTGNVSGNSNTCSRSVVAGSYLTGGGALSTDRTLNVDATDAATASKVVARDASGNFSANVVSANVSGTATNSNFLLYSGGFRSATDAATASSIVARDGSGNFSANVMTGTATAARYADLAEMYLADENYPVGTVVKVGGEKEITAYTALDYIRALGTISDKPAYLMNKDLEGGVPVALKGRVPVRVLGPIQKGQGLGASAIPGVASMNAVNYFAVALEDYLEYTEGAIEAVIL